MDRGAWWAAVHEVAKSRTQLSDFTFTFHFHALEKEMAAHSSVLAWRIPGTGESGGLPSMGSHRVGHNWSDLAAAAAAAACNGNILEYMLLLLRCSVMSSSLWPMGCSPPDPLPVEFSRQEYWSAVPFPTPRDLSDPGMQCLLHWQVDSLPLVPPGKAYKMKIKWKQFYSTLLS